MHFKKVFHREFSMYNDFIKITNEKNKKMDQKCSPILAIEKGEVVINRGM